MTTSIVENLCLLLGTTFELIAGSLLLGRCTTYCLGLFWRFCIVPILVHAATDAPHDIVSVEPCLSICILHSTWLFANLALVLGYYSSSCALSLWTHAKTPSTYKATSFQCSTWIWSPPNATEVNPITEASYPMLPCWACCYTLITIVIPLDLPHSTDPSEAIKSSSNSLDIATEFKKYESFLSPSLHFL